ncbi:MAG: RdgB/HAM1 family non-canonical purine NTP pyrophosphatase [Bacteroidales bacterium]|nr:RdgB/HAM1 family non-canonical purine NTP pyrophosphatase [Bacteroidales bacterium]
MKLIFASGNAGKLHEAGEILASFEVLSPLQAGLGPEALEVEENGSSFEENSRIKAEHLWNLLGNGSAADNGFAVFADDSGLEVDALGGAPGIYTARYSQLPEGWSPRGGRRSFLSGPVRGGSGCLPPSGSGQDANIAKLLSELQRMGAMTPEQRRARFVCAVTLILPDGVHSFRGTCEGHIALEPVGNGGFGYDPVFVADAFPGRTLAQIPDEDKNSISHRGEALGKMAAWLRQHNL